MRSSEGLYLERLDHLRALAVILVFFWHFSHGGAGVRLLPFSYVPPDWAFPLSLLEEGHGGVALFMVLSGYLFTTIIGDRRIVYHRFLLNRTLRLFPILALVMLPFVLRGDVTIGSLLSGFVRDGWTADGSWSIMVELHFYLLLPVLLAASVEKRAAVWTTILFAAVAARMMLHTEVGDVKELAVWSLGGRLDNFLCGMILADRETRWRASPKAWLLAAASVAMLLLFYHAFNKIGGEELASTSILWALIPSIDGIGFSALIFLYCNARFELPSMIARSLAAIGAASYSIYLLHFGVVIASLKLIEATGLSAKLDLGGVIVLAIPVFGVCFSFGWLTYTFIERPVLSLRVRYLRPATNDRLARAASHNVGA